MEIVFHRLFCHFSHRKFSQVFFPARVILIPLRTIAVYNYSKLYRLFIEVALEGSIEPTLVYYPHDMVATVLEVGKEKLLIFVANTFNQTAQQPVLTKIIYVS